jgi:choline dehydrogenase-like flavoprotein
VRGQAQDFDTWARMGNRGWSYADVLPFFKRMESYAGEGEDAFRGREGPLRVTNPQPCDPLFAAIIKAAAAQVGIQYYPNYNGASQEGIAMSQATMAADLPHEHGPLYAHPMRPESRGYIHITAADPRRPRAIDFRAIMTAPAMAPLQVGEVAPGADRTTDDEILDWVKKAAETTYHPVGTCKMGSDPMAVVDAQLRVHGIAGLRVADTSIMPTLTSGNTNAPSIMIGEKAADMVLNGAA